mmetsp:Transcript_47851/g.102239  ORF Transcript_47851/g.102239 Transcript_47851/m.102239 type:complete len:212 (+) Transcript_47851:142-777(+)
MHGLVQMAAGLTGVPRDLPGTPNQPQLAHELNQNWSLGRVRSAQLQCYTHGAPNSTHIRREVAECPHRRPAAGRRGCVAECTLAAMKARRGPKIRGARGGSDGGGGGSGGGSGGGGSSRVARPTPDRDGASEKCRFREAACCGIENASHPNRAATRRLAVPSWPHPGLILATLAAFWPRPGHVLTASWPRPGRILATAAWSSVSRAPVARW